MAEHNNAFAMAYATLHADLRVGRFAPGTRVSAADVLSRLQISATPVREALSRLVGQGMLIDRPSIGYFVPAIDPLELQDLYALATALAYAALDSLDLTDDQNVKHDHDRQLHNRTAGELVRSIASLSPNLALRVVAANVDDRLARLAAIEVHMFAEADGKDGDLADWLAKRQRRQIMRLINRFYRRRIKAVMQIASSAAQTLGRTDTIIPI